MTSPVTPISDEQFVASSTNGESVKIPRELFKAMVEWSKDKRTGSIEVQYKTGGIVGVTAQLRLK